MAAETQDSYRIGSCWECGYSLRGLPANRCPECGRGFDPADEATMNMGSDVRRLVRWLMRPPGWPIHVLTGLAVLMSLWAAAVPVPKGRFVDMLGYLLVNPDDWRELRNGRLWREWENPYTRFLYGAALWLVVLACWTARRVARGVTVKRVAKQRAAPFAYWRRWLVTLVLFGLTIWVCTTRAPTYVGFWASKPWLDRAVADQKASDYRPIGTRMLGVYAPVNGRIGQVNIYPFGAVVEVGYDANFIYRADGTPPPQDLVWGFDQRSRVRRMSAHWFLMTSFD